MLQSFVIRPYQPSDFNEVLEIEKEAFHPVNPAYNIYMYSTFCNMFLVMESEGRIAGYIAVMDTSPSESKIVSFAIKKELRGRGLGKTLLTYTLNEVRKRGKMSVLLEVRVSNKIAQSLYKKMGFREMGIIPNYYHDGEDALLMRLEFTELLS